MLVSLKGAACVLLSCSLSPQRLGRAARAHGPYARHAPCAHARAQPVATSDQRATRIVLAPSRRGVACFRWGYGLYGVLILAESAY